MSKTSKLLALALALVMVLSLAACQPAKPTTAPTTATEGTKASQETDKPTEKPTDAAPTEKPTDAAPTDPVTPTEPENPPVTDKGTIAVYTTSTFGQKFSPFFYTTAYDGEVVSMVTGSLLTSDRGGAVIMNGIKGETVDYNGTDYTYYGMGDCEVIQNEDGTVDYKLTMRDDIVFSDGVPATIDDVIFGIYVYSDPVYDGSNTLYALPIKGMEEYRKGMESRGAAILHAGEENTDFTNWTKEQQDAFWTRYKATNVDLARLITEYVNAKYQSYAESRLGYTYDVVKEKEGLQVALGMAMWGFGARVKDEDDNPTSVFQDALKMKQYDLAKEEYPTIDDYAAVLLAAYEGDYIEMFDTEKTDKESALGITVADLGPDYELGVRTGSGADYISGIEKTGPYTMTVHLDSFDAIAIYDMAFTVAPLHYYGDTSLYDYDAHKFGFTKGDLSIVKAKTTQPLGCGPYVFEGYQNGVVTFTANEKYFLGAPKIETFLFQEGVDSDYVPGIIKGQYDIAQPSINEETVKAIKDANSNDELVGDTITTYLVDYRGYGYIGINADLVNVGGEPGSDASKALRKGFMTLMAIYRDSVIASYYGDRAAVIQYPISNTSWAAPKPADEGFKNAYSTDVEGKPIYDSSMNDEQRFEAAKKAAIGYFKAAGFKYDEQTGKFTDVTEKYEILIPGQGEQDHPAYGVAVNASNVLESLGITLQVNDVGTSVWNAALEENTAMMWAAAWQASVDPDMTQVYSSANAHGNGTNSNHYSVDDADLDALIKAGRQSADTEERKAIYKEAMEIIMDWGCELPTYQRKDCTTVSTIRTDVSTMTPDMTPYWGWSAELEKLVSTVKAQ
ncbi:MAG: ABC transporter substrate-binding protein [Lachnospiraceae bacterium]|nr:ABC transporter substrate-binding protein [Lachnospiraceae bacterium]